MQKVMEFLEYMQVKEPEYMAQVKVGQQFLLLLQIAQFKALV